MIHLTRIFYLSLGISLWLSSHVSAADSSESNPFAPDPNKISTCEELSASIQSLAREHPDFVRLSTLAKSTQGRNVWLLDIGFGDESVRLQNPAMLVVAGIEGDDLPGMEAAMAFAESLCERNESEEIRPLLETTSIYIIPCLNPDSAKRYYETPQFETSANLKPFDNDNDGLIDEDGPDDLNHDGIISWIRIEDPKGKYISHPDDNRILVEADPIKGEQGKWLLITEGKDNDGDEKINEDGIEGVNFNKNFPFDYPWFDPQAGIHQMSENETRALAEFVVSHPHIGIVFTFESQSNLLKKPESGDRSKDRDAQTKIRTEDAKYYEQLGKDYREILEIGKEIQTDPTPGSFSNWMYFHRGRLSLSAPVWSPEIALALKKKEKDEENEDEKDTEDESKKNKDTEEKKDEKKKDEDDRAKTERDYLKWLEERPEGLLDSFLPWRQEIEHPDFPGQKVEIGGFFPYAKKVPPLNLLPDLKAKETEFLIQLAGKHPKIVIEDVKVKHLGAGVYDIRAYVKNDGYLPTVLAHEERTREILPTRLEIDLPNESILAGRKRTILGPLEGGAATETHYLIKAKPGAQVKLEVISALAGRAECVIELNEEGGRS